MNPFPSCRTAAVVAPHHDDEVLGCGGTIARLAKAGVAVDVVTVTRGREPRFDRAHTDRIRDEALAAHASLGVRTSHFLDLPAAELDTLPHSEINQAVGDCLSQIAPDLLFVPFAGDVHIDHQIVFTSAMVWARPRDADAPGMVLAYETLSETNWYAPGITPAFTPRTYVDIGDFLEAKIAAFACFETQVKAFPDERSFDAIRALAVTRGATVYRPAAEAFEPVRMIL